KIDLPTAQVEETIEQMENTLGVKAEEVLCVSAKDGTGVEELLDAIVERIPPPKGNGDAPLQAMIFDSEYNDYRGVIAYVRVVNGTIRPGERIRFLGEKKEYEVDGVGVFRPEMEETKELGAGQVGYITASIKSIQDVRVGDTIAHAKDGGAAPLPGYREPLPMVFCGFYPSGDTTYEGLRRALDRLALNDSSFTYQPETSEALGFGFRCGFLGLLHMEIIQERLEREENVDLIQTAPNVTYEVAVDRGGKQERVRIDNPAKLPEDSLIREWREPVIRANIVTPTEYIGPVMKLCEERRGEYLKTDYISAKRVIIQYRLPFAEIVYDFYDRLKAITRGYGTLDYTVEGHRAARLVRLRILVANLEVDALSAIVHRGAAERKGRRIIQILSKEISRHLFPIPLQAAIGRKVIAREDIKPLMKNVTAKCYGGDVTRKRKLLEKQREGKKRMKSVGNVEIPQSAFMAVLRATE
ncbi:MAG: translation elongation factor 4, partial [Planctomycetota bacterium]